VLHAACGGGAASGDANGTAAAGAARQAAATGGSASSDAVGTAVAGAAGQAAAAGGSARSDAVGTAAAGAARQAAAAGGSASAMSFSEVYDRVIRVRCGACHNDAPSFGGLAFFPGGAATAYANLVGVPAGQEQTYRCKDSGLLRVKPGDPEHSLIYLKLTAPPCGSKMPPAAFGTVSDEQVELVRAWIAAGAAP
jgi:uncharacterized membrane protein